MSAGRRSWTATATLAGALILAASALAATTAPPGKYEGRTSENIGVSFKVPKSGELVEDFKAGLEFSTECGEDVGHPSYEVHIAKIAIEEGSFSISAKFKGSRGSKSKQGTVTGELSGDSVSGTIEIPNKTHGRCEAYKATYTASPRVKRTTKRGG